MKLLFRFLLLLCCVSAHAHDTLTISTNSTPLDRKALQLLSQEAFQRLSLEARIVSLPSERSLVSANQGDVDGEGLRIAGLSQTYPNLLQVPESFTRISFVAFAKNANINLDQGWASLGAYSVAFINGWKMFEANTGQAKTIYKVDKPEQIFQMLDGGRVDLGLYTRADGLALIRSLGLSQLAPLSPALKDVDLYLYLHKKYHHLVPRLAQVLRDMKSDGTYNRIMANVHAQP